MRTLQLSISETSVVVSRIHTEGTFVDENRNTYPTVKMNRRKEKSRALSSPFPHERRCDRDAEFPDARRQKGKQLWYCAVMTGA